MKLFKNTATLFLIISAIPCYGHDPAGLAKVFTIFFLLFILVILFIVSSILSLFVYKGIRIAQKVALSFLYLFLGPLLSYMLIFLLCYLLSSDDPVRTFIPYLLASPVIGIFFGVLLFRQMKKLAGKTVTDDN